MTYEKNIASRRSGGAAWMVGIAVTLLLLGGGVSVHADVIHVPADYETIQEAIDAAVDGDEIIVAPGTYFEAIDFLGKAITVRSSDGPEVTTMLGACLPTMTP